MMNKKGIEFSFGWLFAMIVGAVIIFLAVYAAVKIVGTERTVGAAELSKQLETVLTPVETGYEEGKIVAPIEFPTETRIYNNCTLDGNFGEQMIATDASSGLGEKWLNPEELVPSISYNKYIFSQSVVQGRSANAFSKPFSMPFKIANLLFIYSGKYCFVNPPGDIEEEVNSLSMRDINTTTDLSKCPRGSKIVCFYSEEPKCNVVVDPGQKMVVKNGTAIFYEQGLIYGAIFSDSELYECQVKRLMKRASELALLYKAKSEQVSSSLGGCSSELQPDLEAFASMTAQMNSSVEFREIFYFGESLNSRNNAMTKCKLWES